MKHLHSVRLALLGTAGMMAASAAFAQSPTITDSARSSAQPGVGDIIVTARKRAETSLAVPVTITAVGAAELQRRAINSIDALARVVPSLIAGEGGGTIQGGIIAIRGISGADNNPLNDQVDL